MRQGQEHEARSRGGRGQMEYERRSRLGPVRLTAPKSQPVLRECFCSHGEHSGERVGSVGRNRSAQRGPCPASGSAHGCGRHPPGSHDGTCTFGKRRTQRELGFLAGEALAKRRQGRTSSAVSWVNRKGKAVARAWGCDRVGQSEQACSAPALQRSVSEGPGSWGGEEGGGSDKVGWA